jgi:hypothetical protein
MPQNPWKNKKNKKVSPHVTCPASPQTHPWVDFFLVFSRFLPLCQSNNVSRSFFCVFFVFLFLGSLGEIFTLTSIHWHSFHSSTFYIGAFIELITDLATEPSEKNYSKNSSVTHLFR